MFKKLFKKIKDVAGDIAPYAGLIASGFGLGPLYSTLIGAGLPLVAGQDAGKVMSGGLGGYFGGKTFGSKGAGTYVSPLEILKGGKSMVAGGPKGQMLKDARKLAFDRLKGASQFSGLADDNPFKNLPGVAGALGFAGGLGLFDGEQPPQNKASNFVYDPSQNTLDDIQSGFFQQAQDFDYLPNIPGGIEDYLRQIGLLANGGRSFKSGDDTGTKNMYQLKDEDFMFIERFKNVDPKTISAGERFISKDGADYQELMDKKPEGAIKGYFKEIFGLAEGGIAQLVDPNLVGGDKINPIGGRIVGMGAGREDLLEGEIVDPNSGQTQEIRVSNNEHVIPEYSLFAMGGGDTEKGQQIMDNLREKTRPMAEQMGYDFEGAEDGSMNYAPIMAKDGKETGETIGEVAARPKKSNEVDRQKIYVEVMNYSEGKISDDEFLNKTGFVIPQVDGVRGGGNFDELFNTLMKDLDKRGYTGLASTSLIPTMQDGTQTRGPSMDMRKMIQKLMAQGKSIEEIMAIIQRLSSGSQTKQQQMPMMAADGTETNGLERMSRNMQDGSMTADPMMTAGLGSVVKGLEDAQQMSRMIR